jgi:uncharacterized OsmC-like protein
MTDGSVRRSVTVKRGGPGQLVITNVRGGELVVGRGEDGDFTPTELLLGALGSCTGIDVDILTSRRAAADVFDVQVDAAKVRDELGNHLTDINITFHLEFPDGEAGDAARAVYPEAVQRSHDRLCTVGRTVELGTPTTTHIA